MSRRKKAVRDRVRTISTLEHGRCQVCRTALLQRLGYGQTGLCGPCCTGEADTIGETTVEEGEP